MKLEISTLSFTCEENPGYKLYEFKFDFYSSYRGKRPVLYSEGDIDTEVSIINTNGKYSICVDPYEYIGNRYVAIFINNRLAGVVPCKYGLYYLSSIGLTESLEKSDADEIYKYAVIETHNKTYKEDFYEKFPNANVNNISALINGASICVNKFYGKDVIGNSECGDINCIDCWNKPMKEDR